MNAINLWVNEQTLLNNKEQTGKIRTSKSFGGICAAIEEEDLLLII